MKKMEISEPLEYFFYKLERKVNELEEERKRLAVNEEPVEFDDVERFVRALMTQNIFLHTVGLNGKPESTIMAKATYSINKVIRIYYSTSLDHANQGYIRIHPCHERQTIVVERLHGYLPEAELLYSNKSQRHVIRYVTSWLMNCIDWSKTKLNNLDLYRQMKLEEQKALEAKIAEAREMIQTQEVQEALLKYFGNKAIGLKAD